MGRRKSKDELFEEIRRGGDDDGEGSETGSNLPQPDDHERFEAFSQDEFNELNALFDLLNSNSYETVGEYSMKYVPEDDRKIVTFDVVLPSSNDWDPAVAYEDTDE